jgi:hypothetical protein
MKVSTPAILGFGIARRKSTLPAPKVILSMDAQAVFLAQTRQSGNAQWSFAFLIELMVPIGGKLDF